MTSVFTTLARVLSNWFTGPGDRSYEVGRMLWALSVLCALIFTGVDIWLNGTRFLDHVVEFGTGVGSLLALGGVGIAVKDRGVSVSGPPPAPPFVARADNVNVGGQQ